MTEILIQPYPIDRQIDHVIIFIDDFKLNDTQGSASVYEYDVNDTLLNVSRVPIPTEIWTEWSRDDNYIIDYILDVMGYDRRPELSPVVFPE